MLQHCTGRGMKYLVFVALLYPQSQQKSDFYGIEIKIINKPEIQKDVLRDWTKNYPNPTDEDSRYLLHILESLEERRLHLLQVFNIEFGTDGDSPGLVMNRIRYPIPDRFYETPHTYELLEHVENYMFHHLDITRWENEKKSIYNTWEYEEWNRKIDFIIGLQTKGVKVAMSYEYYEYFIQKNPFVTLDGLATTFESLGYKERPIVYPPKPKKKGPVFGFDLWQK